MVQCNHKSPLKWKREAEPLSEWCLLMVSKMEGAVSQGLQADSRAGKGNKMDFPLEFNLYFRPAMASLVAQRLKRLPSAQETRVWSLSQEDPLEKEMATYSSIRSWRIPWREEPGGLQSMGWQWVRHDWAASLSLSLYPFWTSELLELSDNPNSSF